MGLACGLVFYKIPHDMAGIRSTQAAFYLLCAAHSYLFFPFKASADTSERPTLRLGTGCWSPAFSWTVKCCITHGIPEHVIVQFLFCFIFSSRWVPRQNRNFLRDRIVDPIYRGHVGVVLCRTAEGFCAGNSDGKPILYDADVWFGFLCASSNDSGIRTVDEIRILLREFEPFK